MKKMMKRVLSVVLCIVLLCGVAPMAGLADYLTMQASAKNITQYSRGNTFEFGWYPQSKVTDSAIVSQLNAKAPAWASWTSYGYYSGSGSLFDGQMTAKDYMRYVDITLDGSKYRGVKFTSYRPYCTDYTSSYTEQSDNGYYTNTIYWFKFDPLQWRVLDPAEGLVLCETIIDSQPYNNYILASGTEANGNTAYWGDSAKTRYANNYAESSIRQWLNNDFYNTAFSSKQQNSIQFTQLENKAYSASYSAYDSASTNDKIFFLTYDDVKNTSYGFSSSNSTYDINRRTSGSDYAKCQGLFVTTGTSSDYLDAKGNKCSHWWLRSAGYRSYYASYVYNDGRASHSNSTSNTFMGVRPAFKLNLTSDIFQSEPGESAGTKDAPPTMVNFGDNKVTLEFKQDWFSMDSEVYNQGLGTFAAQFAMLGYAKTAELENALQTMGFSVFDRNLHTGVAAEGETDTAEAKKRVNYFIADRDITVDGETKKLVFAGFIGSNYNQWYSNFDPGTGKTHKSFNDAKNYVLGKLDKYFNAHPELDAYNTVILLTGHSRGAATANLVAKTLIQSEKYTDKENIYTYTFATPNPTSEPDRNQTQYKRIFNIVNPEDFVTKVMLSGWGYGRYGTTFTLPSRTNTVLYAGQLLKMETFFNRYRRSAVYNPYPLGEADVFALIAAMSVQVPSVNTFYNNNFPVSLINWRSPYEFFQQTLCRLVSKSATTGELVEAVSMAVETFGLTCYPIYNHLIKFFLGYQGVGMVTDLLSKIPGMDPAQVLVGAYFEDAHTAETYAAWMAALSAEEVIKEKNGFLGTVNCPVDVEVYEKATGELVGRIVNNTVDADIAAKENAIVMTVDGDSKQYWLPNDADYEVKLIGNDDGTMDFTVAEINSADSVEVQRSNFFDVEITKGKTMTADFIAEETTVEDVELNVENGNPIEHTETLDEEDELLTMNVTVVGNGFAMSQNAVSGDVVTLTAVPAESTTEECCRFDGWYENGELQSNISSYTFVAKENRNLTAKFVTGSHAFGTWNITKPATLTEEGAEERTCSVCHKAETRSTPKLIPQLKKISVPSATVQYKSSAKLTPTVDADANTKYIVTYTSSNPKVATVDNNGNVITKGKGTATITCTAVNDNDPENTVSTTCTVTVKFAWWQWIIWILLFGWIWY